MEIECWRQQWCYQMIDPNILMVGMRSMIKEPSISSDPSSCEPLSSPIMGTDSDLCPPALQKKGYSIGKLIGGGAFSNVYKATLRRKGELDVYLAVKIIKLAEVDVNWKDNCLKKEMKIMKVLKHRFVVKVWEVIKTNSKGFIFMDLAENDSVLRQIEKHKKQKSFLSEATVCKYFSQLMSALEYIHGQQVAHRDLKNDNLLLDSNYNIKLADFGFACWTVLKDSGKNIMSTTFCGTPGFQAPEVSEPPYDAKKADIYSSGIILFEMLSNEKPFTLRHVEDGNIDAKKLRRDQLKNQWSFSSEAKVKMSKSVQKLVANLLDPDATTRPTAAHVRKYEWVNSNP